LEQYLQFLKRMPGRLLPGLLLLACAARARPDSAEEHASVEFFGCEDARLYSRELAASMAGVLTHNFVAQEGELPAGFVRASPVPQPWHRTFWTRDGGTFLRELAKWGYLREARLEAACLMRLVGTNEEGFHAFPRYFDSRQPRSGRELDGTAAVAIGLVLLERELPPGDPVKGAIQEFLADPASPIRFIEHEMAARPLLAGEGEFGGGMGVKGAWCNVVQNRLCALALEACGWPEEAARLERSILQHLRGPDGAWIWCVDPKRLQPDPKVLNAATNRGFGGINGVLCMGSDVRGLEPAKTEPEVFAASRATFQKLLAEPSRRRQFERYGIWSQFDALAGGTLSSPSYGMGYATQDMLLFDEPALAARALAFTAENTFRPVDGYTLRRSSPYYFYERMYSPEAIGRVKLEEGCGALNLVNVAEQLKAARLMVGIDDTDPHELKLVPRLPAGWTGCEAADWPVVTDEGTARVSLSVRAQAGGMELRVHSDRALPSIQARLPALRGWAYFRKARGAEFDFSTIP
jgi:hypothetical protein